MSRNANTTEFLKNIYVLIDRNMCAASGVLQTTESAVGLPTLTLLEKKNFYTISNKNSQKEYLKRSKKIKYISQKRNYKFNYQKSSIYLNCRLYVNYDCPQ